MTRSITHRSGPSSAAADPRPLVLIVDDQEDILRVYSRALTNAGFEVATTATGQGALDRVAERVPSVVLLDANLPDISGEEVLRRLRSQPGTADVPVLIVTGDPEVERRIAVLGGGANDYVVKPVSLGELVARVNAQLRVRDTWLARLDAAADGRRRLAQILAGIDNRDPLAVVETALREVLMSELDLTDVAVSTVHRLDGATEMEVGRGPLVSRGVSGFTIRIPLEAGRAVYAELIAATHEDPDHALSSLLDLAPQIGALLQEPVSIDVATSRDRDEIRSLMEPGAIAPHFQPIVNLHDGSVAGFEGLSRFADGVRPDLRFRQAGRAGLGAELEVAAIRALVDASTILPATAWLSVNVSVHTLLTVDLQPLVSAADRRMVLEITEHELVSDYAAVTAAASRLGGVRLAVDDAGSGYASLRHVYELRPEIVKLDRAWIDGIHEDPVRRALVSGLSTFAEELGAELVGEGVEQSGERDALADLGIPLAQGYFFGRPAPAGTWVG